MATIIKSRPLPETKKGGRGGAQQAQMAFLGLEFRERRKAEGDLCSGTVGRFDAWGLGSWEVAVVLSRRNDHVQMNIHPQDPWLVIPLLLLFTGLGKALDFFLQSSVGVYCLCWVPPKSFSNS